MFLLLTIAGFYWGLTGFLLRSAVDYEQAYFFQRIGGLWPFCIAVFAHFTLVYIKRDDFLKNKVIFYSLLYAPAVFFSFFEITTNQVTHVVYSSLGFWTSTAPESSILYLSSTVWSWSISTIAVMLAVQYVLKQSDKRRKNQSLFVLLGLITPVFLSTVFESVLPVFSMPGIKMTVPGFGLGLVFIGYAIYRYDLFRISPSLAADEIISSMPSLLVLTDQENKIQTINNKVSEALGYNQMDLIGKNINVLFSSDINPNNKDFLDFNQKNMHVKTDIKTKKGMKMPVSVYRKTIFDENENIRGSIIIGEDVREQERTEKRLNDYVKQLEKSELAMISMLEDIKISKNEIEELNKDLERKVEERTHEVERLLKQKNDFIHMLGHDLKNPMTPLTTLLPILKHKNNDPEIQEIIEVMSKNVDYMKNLILKTLQLARLNSSSNTLDFENTDLLEEVDKVVFNNKINLDKNNIDLVNLVDENIIVSADRLRLNELFNNLLSNSVNYTPNGGKIVIDAQTLGDEVKVSIRDTGRGMTKEQVERIFDEFYKADESRHDFYSTGLGLPICKKIVENHGGRIWVESPGPGKGTTFYFTLKKGDTL